MKTTAFLLSLLILVISATPVFAASTSTVPHKAMTKMVSTKTAGTKKPKLMMAAKKTTVVGAIKKFTMTASDWQFTPSTITVNRGDTVEISVTSKDVKHGLMIKAFGINQKLEPGVTHLVKFVASKSGSFPFRCSVPCGEGHMDMTGVIIVT